MSTTDTVPQAPARLVPRRLSERQAELLEAISALVFSEGFAHLTIGDLAERLRCSRTTLYQIAQSKDELVLAAIDFFYQRVGREAQGYTQAHDDPIERLQFWMRITIREFSGMAQPFLEDVAGSTSAQQLIARHTSFAISTIERILADGVERGLIRPIDPYMGAQILQAAIERPWRGDVLRHSGRSAGEWFEEAYTLIIHGLMPR